MSTEQTPLHSGFTAASTAADVIAGIDLSGTTALVTGGASGLGVETARAVAGAEATLVVPARGTTRRRNAPAPSNTAPRSASGEGEAQLLVPPGSYSWLSSR